MRKIIEGVPKPLYLGLLASFAVAAYAWVGQSDYEGEVSDQAFYCSMVEQKYWPARPGMACPVPDVAPGEHLVAL